MIKCPNCSAELNYDVGAQQIVCEYCGSKFNPKELKTSQKNAQELETHEEIEGKSYLCSQCGAKLMTFDETAITFCSYCGSQAMIESKMMKTNKPDFIIPFKKTQEECEKAYKRKLRKAIFAPNYMKSDIVVSKFRGIFMPYVVYSLSKNGETKNKGSKFVKHRNNYDYYDDYEISAFVDAEYKGISYDLVSKFYDSFSHAIPFNYKEVEEFNPNYLISFYADTMNVKNNIYDGEATRMAREDSYNYLKTKKEFRKYGCSHPKAELDISERKIGMFPVYFLAVRDKNNQYVNYAVVNGQTGKVAADLPISFLKYIIGSLILTIPLIFLFEASSVILLPHVITVLAIIFSVISFFVSNSLLNKVYEREHHTDDLGYIHDEKNSEEVIEEDNKNKSKKKKIKNKYPFMYKLRKYLIKQIVAIIICIIILNINPIQDAYYYGAAMLSLGITIWAFKDLVKEHNLLVSTKLPQLEKRGGDEHE